jgi:hypothetical protein
VWEKAKGEGGGGQIQWIYFVFVCENRTMKPTKIVLSGERKKEGVNLIKIYCQYVCKCHNISSMYNYYILIKNF